MLPQYLAAWRRTGNMPGPLKERPELQPAALPYWRAYMHLAAVRAPGGMDGPAPIPISETLALCQALDIDGEDRTRLIGLVEDLEQVWFSERKAKDVADGRGAQGLKGRDRRARS